MGATYKSLKCKLEQLGYNYALPIEAIPLVECILADLVQTTRSLQHYMDLSKEALLHRDSMILEVEPYKNENIKLVEENNHLHRDLIQLKEEYLKLSKENSRKIKHLSDELVDKDNIIGKLKHDVRDLSLRGLCAGTLSSRSKCKSKNLDNTSSKSCICSVEKDMNIDKQFTEFKNKMQSLQERYDACSDEIIILKKQVEHRDNEIIRLNMLLDGRQPVINRDHCNSNITHDLNNQLFEMKNTNIILKKEIENGLEKQHEAMLRALNLADKNKQIQKELEKVDALALKVEENCNKRLSTMMSELNLLQSKVDSLNVKNSELRKQLSQYKDKGNAEVCQESLNVAIKEKNALQEEMKTLTNLNKSLRDTVMSLTQVNKNIEIKVGGNQEWNKDDKYCPTKDELLALFETERKKYETSIEEKLSQTLKLLEISSQKPKEHTLKYHYNLHNNEFIRDLQKKLCECEQKILLLRKENEDLKSQILIYDNGNKENYRDIISHLNVENSELSKENISLSQQLSQYKSLYSAGRDRGNYNEKTMQKAQEDIAKLTFEIELLKKDKDEYNLRYKESLDLVERLKRDSIIKQQEIERLHEENCSYKTTNRTGKASADHLWDECNFLKDQIKKMQSEVIKEKTLASQIKNIQKETERSSNEIQNELLSVQKKLSLSKDTIEHLEKINKDLHLQITMLSKEKSNLLESVRQIDQERDKLVLELDSKTETVSILENKLTSQTYEITKLENDVSELKRKLNSNKVNEHKLIDYETQIRFLNGEISQQSQQIDNAIIENKRLQNSLADANGMLKLTKIEHEKSKKEVDTLKQQLQHYVAEVRRIEELLSHKEAERSDMLEQFASLSVEANILENTNHSLENESASKSLQLQTYVNKIQNLETQLTENEARIESQALHITSLTCKVNSLENEVKLLTEEKGILEQNVSYLKQMCNNLQSDHTEKVRCINNSDNDLKLFENKIKKLTHTKTELEIERDKGKEKLQTTENLLSKARREIVELKLALQDATSETKLLQDRIILLSTKESDNHDITLRKELELPLMSEETIHEVSHEEDDDSSRYREVHKRLSKYSRSETL